MLLKRLCEENGVSGNEEAVRDLIYEELRRYADEVHISSIGNMIALKKGRSSEKRVMVAAHMDEVGFIISGFTDQGYLKFKKVGGIDTRVLISKKVTVGPQKIKGVIGMKAIHLQKKEERENVPEVQTLFIDIGAKNKEDAQNMVQLGDYAAFDTEFSAFGDGKYKGKALDDRAGCAVMLNLIKDTYEYDTYFCFTVQEEVGLRGAQVAANAVKPDIALVLETTTCSDVHGTEPHEYATQLGKGVVVTFMDMRTIMPAELVDWLYRAAKEAQIPVQYKNTTMGGNDAGAIHVAGHGARTAALSIPCRYLHAPAGVIAESDMEAMKNLAALFLRRINEVI